MKVDLVIPVFNNEDYTIQCLTTLRDYTQDYRVILIDNASTQESKDKLKPYLEGVEVITLSENVGFIKATNIGIARSTAPYIVLLNNDTVLTPNWLDKLIRTAETAPQAGLVGPVTIYADSWQNKEKMGTMLNQDLIECGMLAFFCVLIKREVIEKVGYLSEEFGIGFGDDDDYCERVKQAGYKLYVRTDVTIPHFHRTTFKKYVPNWLTLQHENIAKFHEKYPK